MDCAPDNGMGWREQMAPRLRQLGIGILNPCDKPTDLASETPQDKLKLNEAITNNDYNTLVKMTKGIVGVDLRMVHKSDFLILYIDKEIFMFGSVVEFSWAIQQRKPVLIVCKQGKKAIPLFAYGMSPHTMMFGNFDEMLLYLKDIDDESKPIEDLRRWYFFDFDRIYKK